MKISLRSEGSISCVCVEVHPRIVLKRSVNLCLMTELSFEEEFIRVLEMQTSLDESEVYNSDYKSSGPSIGDFPQRRSARYSCDIGVSACVNHSYLYCTMINISAGGAAFRGKGFVPISIGDKIVLTSKYFSGISGRVRWVGQAGFGVEFDQISSRSKQLKLLIESLDCKR